jgi:hypothetical protein
MYGLKPVPFTEMSFSAASKDPQILRIFRGFKPPAPSGIPDLSLQ